MTADFFTQILEAARVGESTDWEFKSAKGGLPGNLWQTYSAFANTEGGTLILGARETDDGVQLDGLSLPQLAELQKVLWDLLNNRGKVSRNLLTNDDVAVVDVNGKQVLAVHVPRATRGARPIFLSSTPFGNTYRRYHEGDYRCADDEVRRMLADADSTPADHRILLGFSLADLDTLSLSQYRQRFRASRGEHPWLALENQDLLERLGGWRKERDSSVEGLTLAGLLMFGKDVVIRDPGAAPTYFVDYREKLDPDIRWTDRVYPDGTWEANLFQFYQRVWPKVSGGLPVPFRLQDGVRRDDTPVHEALREALINSLIHADYAAPGGVVVERYPDRFVLENPGTLLVSLEQFRRGGVSECRNKALQRMFQMIGGGDQAGSGVDKIRSGWRSQHWRIPLIKTQFQPDRVRLVMPMVSLIPEGTLQHLRELFGSDVDRLTPDEVQVLATADIEGSVSNARLQELLANHPVDITRVLAGLRARGWLVSDNRRRWATYQLAVNPLLTPDLDSGQTALSFGGESSGMGVESSGMGVESSGMGVESSGMELASEELLRQIAAPVAGRSRASPQKMRATILELCNGRYLSREALGALLQRNPDNLRNTYLTPLVKERLLALKYPESPNRPGQAYTTMVSTT